MAAFTDTGGKSIIKFVLNGTEEIKFTAQEGSENFFNNNVEVIKFLVKREAAKKLKIKEPLSAITRINPDGEVLVVYVGPPLQELFKIFENPNASKNIFPGEAIDSGGNNSKDLNSSKSSCKSKNDVSSKGKSSEKCKKKGKWTKKQKQSLRKLVESYGKQTGFFGTIKTNQELFALVTKDFNEEFAVDRTVRQVRETWNSIKDDHESQEDDDEEDTTDEDDDNEVPKEESRMTNAERVEFILAERDRKKKIELEERREEKKQAQLEMMDLFFQKWSKIGQ